MALRAQQPRSREAQSSAPWLRQMYPQSRRKVAALRRTSFLLRLKLEGLSSAQLRRDSSALPEGGIVADFDVSGVAPGWVGRTEDAPVSLPCWAPGDAGVGFSAARAGTRPTSRAIAVQLNKRFMGFPPIVGTRPSAQLIIGHYVPRRCLGLSPLSSGRRYGVWIGF